MRYLEQIEITNYRSIKHAVFVLYPSTVIIGHNGVGKSATLEGLAAIFEPGGDVVDIRNGAKQAELRLQIAGGYTAVKTIKPKKVELVVEDPRGGDMPAPATVLGQLFSKDSFNTREILKQIVGDKKGLDDFILKRIPTSVQADSVNEAVGEKVTEEPMTVAQLRALEKAKYNERTRINTEADEAKKALRALEDAAGTDEGVDWGSARDAAAAEIASIDASLSNLKAELNLEREERVNSKRAHTEKTIAGLRQRIAELESGMREFSSRADTAVAEALAEEGKGLQSQRNELVQKHADAAAKAQQQQRAVGVRNQVDGQRKRMEGYVTNATRLSIVIDSLRRLATDAIKNIGIPGLDIVEDGKDQVITYDAGDGAGSVRIDKLNEQKRIFLGVNFLLRAQAASGVERRAIVVEGAGIVPSLLKQLAAACEAANAQLIVAIPADGEPLQVMSLEEFQAKVAA